MDAVYAIFFGGVVIGCVIAAAFLVGRHCGYWERVEEEERFWRKLR